jgi:hypothetical protein
MSLHTEEEPPDAEGEGGDATVLQSYFLVSDAKGCPGVHQMQQGKATMVLQSYFLIVILMDARDVHYLRSEMDLLWEKDFMECGPVKSQVIVDQIEQKDSDLSMQLLYSRNT